IVFVVISYSFHLSENYFPSDFIRGLIIFTIAAYAVRQPTLSCIQSNIHSTKEDEAPNQEQVVPETIDLEIATDIIEPEKPTRPKEVNAELVQKIIDTVETEKLYLNEELTIADLAKKLGYSSKTISHNINNGLQKSFSLFINEYRVNLFKEKKASGKYDQLSIMGLAYDCGFNSKSTFNRIFKEITGCSPKDQKSSGE
ncbi:MAG: helix-turn-helix domain-containing protein, partial [Ferruginibacter sp.]